MEGLDRWTERVYGGDCGMLAILPLSGDWDGEIG